MRVESFMHKTVLFSECFNAGYHFREQGELMMYFSVDFFFLCQTKPTSAITLPHPDPPTPHPPLVLLFMARY